MASIVGFGRQRQDIEFGTLSCNGKIIIDEQCNLKIKNITVKELTVTGNIMGGGGASAVFSAQRHALLNIPSFSQTTIPYDTIVVNEGFGYDTNTGIVTVLQTGIYQINVLTNFFPLNATYISSTINTSTGAQAQFFSPIIPDEALNSVSPCITVSLTAGDTIYVQAFQSGMISVQLAPDGNTNISIKQI